MTRRTDPSDRRATLASLTEAGWRKVVATAPGHVAEVRRLVFDDLSPEQVPQLRDICTRVAAAARPDVRRSPVTHSQA
jgi:DNA-binding MarR family transcriptional regulator